MDSLPLYMQVANEIRERINQGILKPGDMLESEHDLAAKYSASRTTIRKGLSILFSEGFINPVPGKGYFVRNPEMDRYTLYFNEKHCIQHPDQIKLLEVKLAPATSELRRQLGIKKKTFIMIRWLIYADRKPVAYDVKYLPYERGKPIVEREIQYATFPEMVAKHQSLFSIKKVLKVTAPKPNQEVKALLKLEQQEPLILIEQTILDSKDTPIGYGRLFIRGEYCNLVAISSYNHDQRATV